MLLSLEIQNYALIDALYIDFDKGLNIVTGETGAGKSIMLGALGLVMGNRADSKVLYDQNKKCYVEAKYATHNPHINTILEENDLDRSDTLIIRREIGTNGKSRAFVNDTPTTIDVLAAISEYLIDIHQQFDTQTIQKAPEQLRIIDLLAKNQNTFSSYQAAFLEMIDAQKKLQQLIASSEQANKDLDYQTFQLNELIEANLSLDDHQEEMEQKLHIIESTEEIKAAFAKLSLVLLDHDQSIISSLNGLLPDLRGIASMNHRYEAIQNRLISSIEELKDIAIESSNIAEGTEFDEEEAYVIRDKLNSLYRLQKKHGVNTIQELLDIKEKLAQEIDQYNNLEKYIILAQKTLETATDKAIKLGLELTNSRKKITASFEQQVQSNLSLLAMPNARLEVEISPKKEPSINGLDEITFKFAANKGSELQSVKEVASGGETSRLALVIKSIIAMQSSLPTMVFDEIDSGVSGEVALRMGQILTEMANHHQMITITHAPQVAAKADKHFFVYKYDTDARTLSDIRVLDKDGRITEIAKMMSGDPPTPSALKAAAELILTK